MPKDPGSHGFESECNATAIRKASRRVTQFYDSFLEPAGLRSTQLAILNLVERSSTPLTMGRIADALVIDRSALGHNLRPLLRDGLLVLEPSTLDRRQTNVALTALGKQKCRTGRKLWQRAQDRFEGSFGRVEAARLREAMLTIAHSEALASEG